MAILFCGPLIGDPILWDIGIPDPPFTEFLIPDPNPKYINTLYLVNHAMLRHYGLREKYVEHIVANIPPVPEISLDMLDHVIV